MEKLTNQQTLKQNANNKKAEKKVNMKEKHEKEMVHSEKLRYKNADEIYE